MTLQVSRIRAICFDVDGTLSDTDDMMVALLTELLKPFHFLFLGKDLTRVARGIVMVVEAPAYFIYSIPATIQGAPFSTQVVNNISAIFSMYTRAVDGTGHNSSTTYYTTVSLTMS